MTLQGLGKLGWAIDDKLRAALRARRAQWQMSAPAAVVGEAISDRQSRC